MTIFPFRHFLQRWSFLPIYDNLSLRNDDKEAWRNPSYDKETKRCFLYCNKIMKFCLDIKFIWVLMFISEDLGVIPASFLVLVSRSRKINWFLSPSLSIWRFKPHRICCYQTEQYWSLVKFWNLEKSVRKTPS